MSEVSDEARKALMEDRLKVFYVSELDLVNFIRGMVKIINLPEDAVIYRAYLDQSRRAVAVVISHPSFDRSEPGFLLPDHGPLQYELVKPEDQPKQIQFREFF